MSQAVDYSFSRPNPADLAAAGYVGALRYLAPLPNAKVITGDEIAALHKNGLAVGFVWESGASRAGQGSDAGAKDAAAANLQADDLGVPDTVTIYFAVDYDANPDSVVPYFEGAQRTSKRPIGGYGSYTVVEALLDAGLIVHAWQTVAWSRGKRSNRSHLFQRADAAANPPPNCDVNEVLVDDWGQWAAASTPAPQPQPEDIVKATYMRRKDSPNVVVVFDTGVMLPVLNYANTEEVFKNELGVQFVDYSVTEDNTDAFGNTRKVWVTDDPGLIENIAKAIQK